MVRNAGISRPIDDGDRSREEEDPVASALLPPFRQELGEPVHRANQRPRSPANATATVSNARTNAPIDTSSS